MRKADIIDVAMRIAGFALMTFMVVTGRDNEFALMVAAVMIFAPAKGLSLLKMRFGPALESNAGPVGVAEPALPVAPVAQEEPQAVSQPVPGVGTDQPAVADDGNGRN